jgi:hypothetical protein
MVQGLSGAILFVHDSAVSVRQVCVCVCMEDRGRKKQREAEKKEARQVAADKKAGMVFNVSVSSTRASDVATPNTSQCF